MSLTHTPYQVMVGAESGIDSLPVLVQNTLGWPRREVVRVTTSAQTLGEASRLRVVDANGRQVRSQVNAVLGGEGDNPDIAAGSATFSLHFVADVPALGVATYFLETSETPSALAAASTTRLYHVRDGVLQAGELAGAGGLRGQSSGGGEAGVVRESTSPLSPAVDGAVFAIESAQFRLGFDSSGMLQWAEDRAREGARLPLRQEYAVYKTSRSGAYLFRPTSDAEIISPAPASLERGRSWTIGIVNGPLVSELQLMVPRSVGPSHTYRLHSVDDFTSSKNNDGMEAMNGVVSVEYRTKAGRNNEIVSRFNTGLVPESPVPSNPSAGQHGFLVDNGVHMMQRIYSKDKPMAANFYPAVTAAGLRGTHASFTGEGENSELQFTVLTRQSFAAASLKPGSLELMIHRNLAQDDGRGIATPLNDNSYAQLETRLMLAPAAASEARWRRQSLRLHHPLVSLYATNAPGDNRAPVALTRDRWLSSFASTVDPLAGGGLPPDVHLMDFKARHVASDELILRLQHLSNGGGSGVAGEPLLSMAGSWSLSGPRAVSLSANGAPRGNQTLRWNENPKMPLLPASLGSFAAPEFQLDGADGNADEEGVFVAAAWAEHDPANSNRRRMLAVSAAEARVTALSFDDPLRPFEVRSFVTTLGAGGAGGGGVDVAGNEASWFKPTIEMPDVIDHDAAAALARKENGRDAVAESVQSPPEKEDERQNEETATETAQLPQEKEDLQQQKPAAGDNNPVVEEWLNDLKRQQNEAAGQEGQEAQEGSLAGAVTNPSEGGVKAVPNGRSVQLQGSVLPADVYDWVHENHGDESNGMLLIYGASLLCCGVLLGYLLSRKGGRVLPKTKSGDHIV